MTEERELVRQAFIRSLPSQTTGDGPEYNGPVHVCGPECLLQPALSQVCRQLRAETLPIFYGINSFHFDTTSYYDPHKKHILVSDGGLGPAAVHPGNPRAWWRTIGDSNLRLVRYIRVVDRAESEVGTPDVEVVVDRRGVGGEKAQVREKVGKRTSPGARPKETLEPATDTDVIEAKEQMAIDGPFVRGIERALLRHRTLGITAVDWPAVATRPKGAVKISDVPGFGVTWAYFPGDGEE